MRGRALDEADRSRRGWLRKLGGVARPHWRALAGAVVASTLGGLAASAGPLVQKVIVDDVIVAHTRSLAPWLGLLLVIGLATMVLTMARRYLGTRFSLAVQQELGVAVYGHVNRLDARARQELPPGDVFSRATVDIRLLNAVLGRIHAVVGHTVHLVTVLAAMLWLSTSLALLMAALVPVFAYIAWRMRARLFPATWHGQQSLAETTSIVAETASGIRVVKAFGQAEREGNRYLDASRHLFRSRLRTFRLNAFYGSTLEAMPGLGQVILVAVGGLLAINGEVTLGTFVAFASYVTELLNPIRSLVRFFASSQQARAGATRVFAFLETSNEVEDRPVRELNRSTAGLVEFDKVSFGYQPGRPVLRDLSLRIEAGERVAVVGLSGSGKSTLARLLVRMYDTDQGAVRIDGRDVRNLGLDDLRRQVGGVVDTPRIFFGFGRRQHRLRRPRRHYGTDRGSGIPGRRHGVHRADARWLSVDRGRERADPVGWAAPASRPRPSGARRARRAGPRRGHVCHRFAHRGDDPPRDPIGSGTEDDDRHRQPALYSETGRPDRRARRRANCCRGIGAIPARALGRVPVYLGAGRVDHPVKPPRARRSWGGVAGGHRGTHGEGPRPADAESHRLRAHPRGHGGPPPPFVGNRTSTSPMPTQAPGSISAGW